MCRISILFLLPRGGKPGNFIIYGEMGRERFGFAGIGKKGGGGKEGQEG